MSTLQLSLAESVSVVQLTALLSVIENMHLATLWLDLAERNAPGEKFPDAYVLTSDEMVWIERLEIGTPNKLRVKGPTASILKVTALLAGFLALPVTASEGYKNVVEAQKASLETDLLKLEIVDKAEKLYQAGKISREAYEHKARMGEQLRQTLPLAGTVVQRRDLCVGSTSEEATTDESAKLDPEMGSYDAALPAVTKYFDARAAFMERHDQESQFRLEQAYEEVARALPPMSDTELQQFLEAMQAYNPRGV